MHETKWIKTGSNNLLLCAKELSQCIWQKKTSWISLLNRNWFCIFPNIAGKEQNSATHQFSPTHLLLFSGQKQRTTGMWKWTLEHQWTVLVNHPLVGKQFHPVDMCRISQTLDRKNNSCLPTLRTLSVSAGQFSFELLHGPWLQLQTRPQIMKWSSEAPLE